MIKDISFEITQKCLNNCLHCSSCSNKNCKQQIDFLTICKTIDDMPKMGVKRVCLSGGEPFLHENIDEIISYISNLNIEVNIYSSGVVEKNGKACAVSYQDFIRLKLLGLSKIMFNVQSSNEDLYNKITGTKGHFPILKDSISNAVKAGIYTEIHFVPMKVNFYEIENIILFSKQIGIDRVSFLKLVPHGRAKDNEDKLCLAEEQNLFVKNKLKEINSSDIRIGIPLSIGLNSEFCHAASSKLYIKFDGSVYGCEAFKYITQLDEFNNTIEPNNIFRDNLLDIFKKSEYIKATRMFIKKYSSISSKCESCPVQKFLEQLGE